MANKSGHNGKVKTLKREVEFGKGVSLSKGTKVIIRGVNMIMVKIQVPKWKFDTYGVAHDAINW